MTEIYLRPRNPNCKCKWCAFLRITIVPPSNEQYCSNLRKYVRLEKRIEVFELNDNITDLECEVAKLTTKQKNVLAAIQELEENIYFDKKQGIEKYPSHMIIYILSKIREELK